MADKLSDNEVHDRLTAALELLGEEEAENGYAQTALAAARKALLFLGFGVLKAGVNADDAKHAAIKTRPSGPATPP